ncbi:MAG TPA: 5-(carboxyamino)imidazole ribonucleotide mutase [Fervidobacterium nodosum]|nr:5-(carboxyamino)imidazole ribonucleotide mutase [Fervidobacterium sp. 2310opik-2]HOJ94435.1 5-(carboxyamino)imidazole ribonucleotide mutase [Fervidobacterium nodosum]
MTNKANMPKHPIVGIIMGSDSDLKVMKFAAQILEEFNVPYEITIVSAHRTPQRMFEYARNAESRGIEVIIAGAGGAAHLPGMVASITSLPVIGVPVKASSLDGLDSLLSIVQMPKGVPVATVAINNAQNAGLLAVQILSLKYPELKEKIKEYRISLQQEVIQKAKLLEELGYEGYEKHQSHEINESHEGGK